MSDDEAISEVSEDTQKSEISDNNDSDMSDSISTDSESDDQNIDGAEVDDKDDDSDSATVVSSRHKYITPSFMSKSTNHLNMQSNIINPESSRIIKVTPFEEMRTISKLSLYEFCALMVTRIKALENGDVAFVDTTKFNNPESIALEEIMTGKCPLLIKRVVGRGFVEIVSPNPLTKFIDIYIKQLNI